MSQAVLPPRHAPSNVWYLRRKKVPDELSLPADYVPTDYTSLPPEEPKKRGINPLALGLLLLLVLGAIAAAYFLLPKNQEVATPPPPATTMEFSKTRMIVSENKLTTQIEASTNAPDGSEVTATLLENDVPFEFFDAEAAKQTVTAGQVKFAVPESNAHEKGRRSAKYTVQLTAALPNGTTKVFSAPLEINPGALSRFLGEDQAGGAVDEPTPTTQVVPTTPPEAPTTAPTSAPTPNPIDVAPVPVPDVVISKAGIVYTTPYGPALRRGDVVQGQIATIVVKLPISDETWYLAVVPATGVAGWINSNIIDLPPSDVARITTVTGEAPYAVVFNGGNVRATPGGNVVTQINAGQNVRLVGRLADSSWFQIESSSGNGWVIASLLTVNPNVLETIPVSP